MTTIPFFFIAHSLVYRCRGAVPESTFSRQRRSGIVLVSFSMATALFFCVGGGSGSSGSSGSMNWMNFTNGDDDCGLMGA